MASTDREQDEEVLSLKMMVDTKAKKVVFAEAEQEFVDFIFSLLSLPLSTVTKVLEANGKEMVGSLGALVRSVDNLDSVYFKPGINENSVLDLRATVTVPLLSLHDCCFNRIMSRCKEIRCKCHSITNVRNDYICSRRISAPTFVKEGVVYMVMDNLRVKPMSITLIKSTVPNFDDLEAKEVKVGLQEGLAILKASLQTKAVLTTVFLNKILK